MYFYPRSPCGERHVPLTVPDLGKGFLSTLSLRRATCRARSRRRPSSDFYPRSPCGERLRRSASIWLDRYFYPRSPCGERPPLRVPAEKASSISIHALLAESDIYNDRPKVPDFVVISIHALLAESDGILGRRLWYRQQFLSTLSLRRATYGRINDISRLIFLSTLSLRRATTANRTDPSAILDFYPRSPCGERPASIFCAPPNKCISIHALLAESDLQIPHRGQNPGPRFLSTLSLRRATRFCTTCLPLLPPNFYPRSPCGERPAGNKAGAEAFKFLSTLSLRRATASQTNLPSKN